MKHPLGSCARDGALPAIVKRRKPLVAAVSAAVLLGVIGVPAAAQDFPAVLPLASLDGTIGFKLDGEAAEDYSGRSVSAAGDVNGDGIDDLIIGADRADPNGSSSGRSYLVFGRDTGFPATLQLSALDGSTGFKLDGEAAGDSSGVSVSGAGDVNGDGIDDLIIGAHLASGSIPNSGRSYVVFGRSTGYPPSLPLSDLDGSDGFTLDGEATGDWSGFSVSAAGDVNGDDVDDLIIGASGEFLGVSSGRSYVVFGSSTGFPETVQLASLNGSDGFSLNGEFADDRAGRSVGAVGDINGDGIDDLIIGAPVADANGSFSGRSYVVFGRDDGFPATVQLSDLDGSTGFKLDGEAAGDSSGISVSAAGDINGDGIDDLIIGAYGSDASGSFSGRSYVVFGRDTGFPATLQLSVLDGSTGFKIDGEAAGDFSGISVSAADDINGDGIDDVIIGAFGAHPNGSLSGRSYVVFGRDMGFPATLQLSALDGTTGYKIDGEAADDLSGRSVSAAGDVNGDGVDDLIVGAAFADPNGGNSGRSYVVFGRGLDRIFANGFEPD